MIFFTNQQARRFLLSKQGLLGEYRFMGKEGAFQFVRQAGCIQFDPINPCGRNAELTLQSRVKGFTKQMLSDLLYQDRLLVDYPDKNLSILPAEDWPYFSRYRQAARENGRRFEGLAALEAQALAFIRQHGPVSAEELPVQGRIHWHSAIHWSGNWAGDTKASRSVLEQLYSTGELIVHHKKGNRKYYDLAQRHLSESLLRAPEPLPDDFEHLKWRIRRRIGAVGLLWNRPSDAWLNIWELKTPQRQEAFRQLSEEGKILPIQVEGIRSPLFCVAEDFPLLETILRGGENGKPRCELIAPLDCMMWDRNLIRALFGFDYQWEIYTPADRRIYGYYVLPILYGDRLIGRMEPVADEKTGVLTVKNIWYESGVRQTKKLQTAVERCLKRFAKWNGCNRMVFLTDKDEKL